MSRSIALLTGAVLLSIVTVENALSADLMGDWTDANKEGILRISKCLEDRTAWCGTLIWVRDAVDRKFKNKVVIAGMHQKDSSTWTGGTVFHKRSGLNLGGSLILDGSGKLVIHACAPFGLKCGSYTLRRSS